MVSNIPLRDTALAVVAATQPITQPYWMAEASNGFTYANPRPSWTGLAEAPGAFPGTIRLRIINDTLTIPVQPRSRSVDPVDGETYRPIHVSPPVVVSIADKVILFTDAKPKKIAVKVHSERSIPGAAISLHSPSGWKVAPATIPLHTGGRGASEEVSFMVTPEPGAVDGLVEAHVAWNGRMYSHAREHATYKHIPPQVLYVPAELEVVRLDLRSDGRRVGYIMGAGDEVPDALQRMGFRVTVLSDTDLRASDLSVFPTIVAGIRAYNTRPILRDIRPRLENFMKNGGTYIVQYVTPVRGESDNIGPYPLTIGRDRVTEENAAVEFLDVRHALLTSPNAITQRDLVGWVQERGLSFASQWSPEYTPILSMHDAGEAGLRGSLLTAAVGKGTFIYTGLAFFRQLPAGVPGAYRMFANLIMAGSKK